MVRHIAVDPSNPLNGGPRPLRGPFTRWPRITDALLAVVMFLSAVFTASFEDPENNRGFAFRLVEDIPIAAYIILAMACIALYWRRRRPLVVFGVNLFASVLWVGLGPSVDPLIGLLVSMYGVGRYLPNDRTSHTAVGGAVAAVGIGALIDGQPAGDIPVNLLVMLLAWYIGKRIRIRGEYPILLQERAAQLERERAAEARRAVAEERARIARELHDVVAHRVSLMTVQAGAAKTVAADDPAGARQAMEAVEQAGRQALGELRHLLGVLRPETEAGELGPQPGLADIPQLVDQLEQAGMEVSLAIDDLPTDLPIRVDLSVYRIVQEALTNVLKHAGPGARTEVRLSNDNRGVTIEVLNAGNGGTILPGSGQGIVGMRERALLLGGSLDAGPRPGGGYQVVAHLPISPDNS